MDRSWMYNRVNVNRHGLKKEYVHGVQKFVKRALKQPICICEGGIRCPCTKCKCTKISTPVNVRLHLYQNGFQPEYWIWTEHGEEKPNVDESGGLGSNDHVHHDDQFDAMDQMLYDAFRLYEDVPHASANIGNEILAEGELPNTNAKQFYDKLISFNKPIYEGATESKLSISVKLLTIMAIWHVPQKGIDFFAQMLKNVCPVKNCFPENCYQATQLVSKLGLKVEKIDCCKKGCMLYYKDDSKLSECKFCSAPRFFPRRIGMGKYKDVPTKRMFYFPIIPRLQRLYASTGSASEMRWHQENKSNSNLLRHPSDGKSWKHFDEVYPEFAREPRNVRLGLCSDGFTPYIQASAGPYSCWPIVVTPYNLPPEMCMTKPYLFLACLVPGPNNPKEKVDVYLQPLIDDLQQLWSNGILTYDISTKQNFIMKACLMWTINDFPAYGMLSGWGTQGRLACPHCMGDTKAFYLKNGGKNTWFGCQRQFLAADHPFRKSKRSFKKNEDEKKGPPHISTGQEIWEAVSIFPKVTEIGWEKKLKELNDSRKDYKYGVHHNWRKRSIFWDLPYWKDNLLRHNLDVMHIEKNFFDNIFYTVMDIKGKTKDNEKARKDMAECCFRGDLEMQALFNGKMGKPKASYTMTKSDAKLVCKWLKELRMPDGYASNLARCADVEKGVVHGMKSHDGHVFMECLLPIAFRSLPNLVWKALTEISQFFKDLCSNTLTMDDLVKLDQNIAIFLCKLERFFPPGFFDSMEHLPIHLAYEAMLGGPVHYRWMYPFERFMGVSKQAVTNKASYMYETILNHLICQFRYLNHLICRLVPAYHVSKALGYAIRKQFYKPIHSWSQLGPKKKYEAVKAVWFERFGEKVSWDPRDHAFVYRVFEQKGAKRLTDMLTKARKKGRPEWISVDAWTGLETYWKTNPNFLKSSNQNKTNRASTKGGAVHTSGRKAHIDVALELSNNLERDLDPDELFLYTHKRKTGEWIDSRSQSTYESFKKKLSTVQAQIDETTGDGVQEVDGGTKLRLWTESAGGRTRGRVYGTADLSVNLRRGCTSFTQKTQDHHGSMYEISLEAERAARVRAEEKAAIAEKKADDALAQSQVALDLNKQMMIEIAEFKKFVMERDRRSGNGSGNGSCSATQPPSHPHYDDNLDDQSLHSDS